MSFGATAPLFLEGNYSSWSVYDEVRDDDIIGADAYDVFAVFNKDATKALFVYMGLFGKTYDVAAKTLSASLFDTCWFGGGYIQTAESAYRTYAAFVSFDQDEIYICKNGALLETHTVADLGHAALTVVGASISPDGKYVVVALEEGFPENEGYWVILEGS